MPYLQCTVLRHPQVLRPIARRWSVRAVNASITATNFPFTNNEGDTVRLVLAHFNRDISSKDAVKKMAQFGYKPAMIEHLMAYGAQRWDLQPERVACLGSSWMSPTDRRCVPCLRAWRGDRRLNLYCWHGYWRGDWHFLAIAS